MTHIRPPFGGNVQSTIDVDAAIQLIDVINGNGQIPDNSNVIISGEIDLNGVDLPCGRGVSFSGHSPESNIIKSTGLETPLITSNYGVQFNNLAFHDLKQVYDLDATANPTEALDWFKVNFLNCERVGMAKNFANSINLLIGVLNSDFMEFDGSFGTIAFNDSIFTGTGTGTTLVLPSGLNVSRRVRLTDCAIVAFGSQIGIDYQSPTIPTEGLILTDVNFSGGATYLQGIDHTDNVSLFTDCNGITNSADIGQMCFQDSATATTVTDSGTFYKIEGTTVEGEATEKFSHTNGRLTYDGALTDEFMITAVVSANSGNNKVLAFRTALNGTTRSQGQSKSTSNGSGRSENVTIIDALTLTNGDYIEVFCANTTDTANITVSDFNIIITRL
jgi:hypothetical protein